MEEIRGKYSLDVKRVISEPGDGTRYDYIVVRNHKYFMFSPYENTFRYPQRIDIWSIRNAKSEDDLVMKIAKEESCNPWTVKECIRWMKEATEGDMQ